MKKIRAIAAPVVRVVSKCGPVFYAGLFGMGSVLYFKEVPYRLPNPYLSSLHLYVSIALAILCITSFIMVFAILDPGVITRQNIKTQFKYPVHLHLYPSETSCNKCSIPRIPRSKHCKVCQTCVARFSHHCFWFNRCIGARNYRGFLLFLLLHVISCGYAIVVTTGVILASAATQNDRILHDRALLVNALQHTFLSRKNRGLLVVTSISLVAVVLVGFFLAFHIYLVLSNVTAYEWYKRGVLRDVMEEVDSSSREGIPDLDPDWGGLFQIGGNTVKKRKPSISMTISDINYNPYSCNSWFLNVKDALNCNKRKQHVM